MRNAPFLALSVALSFLASICGLVAYDRLVVRPGRVIGVVDVGEVYRAKESEFAARVTNSRGELDRKLALEQASAFAAKFAVALDELPAECGCIVLVRSAVAGTTPATRDLTPLLKSKL